MKIKLPTDLEIGDVLTLQELKSITYGPTFNCICIYGDRVINPGYITNSQAGCDIRTCIDKGYCPDSWRCRTKCEQIPDGGSGSTGSSGSDI